MTARGSNRVAPLLRRAGRDSVLVIAVLVLLLAGTLLGSVYLVDRPATRHTTHAQTPAPQLPEVRAVTAPLAAVGSAAPVPNPAALKDQLDPLTRGNALGPHVGIVVTDVAANRVLYARRGDLPVLPASTAKLATALASVTALGPTHRLRTATVLVRPAAGLTRVVLVGGGDPTLEDRGTSLDSPQPAAYPRPAKLLDLVRATAHALRSLGVTRVRVDVATDRYTGPSSATGWKPLYLTEGDVAPVSALEVDEGRVHPRDRAAPDARSVDPALAAGGRFRDRLRRFGVTVAGPVQVVPAPRHGSMLAAVGSAPISALVAQMLQRSDNDLAEALTRQVAIAQHRPPSFAGGSAAVRGVLARRGLADGIRLVDGSGLSRLDRVTPLALTRLLVAAARTPSLRPLVAGLAVGGFSGTLRSRFREAHPPFSPQSGAGVVRAKTGTLTGVSALAGLAVDADGRLLAYAVVAPQVAPTGTVAADAALDAVADTLGRCGCA